MCLNINRQEPHMNTQAELTQYLLDNLNEKVYVIERDTWKLLFANKRALGDKQSMYLEKTCFSFVRGKSEPCQNCVVKQNKIDEPLSLEWKDTERKKTYHIDE